jgi:hypothetical protein
MSVFLEADEDNHAITGTFMLRASYRLDMHCYELSP